MFVLFVKIRQVIIEQVIKFTMTHRPFSIVIKFAFMTCYLCCVFVSFSAKYTENNPNKLLKQMFRNHSFENLIKRNNG